MAGRPLRFHGQRAAGQTPRHALTCPRQATSHRRPFVLAETLLDAALGQAPVGAPVYLDAPEVNAAAMSIASGRQMRQVFATARMYNLRQPPLPLDRIFGVTTFELG